MAGVKHHSGTESANGGSGDWLNPLGFPVPIFISLTSHFAIEGAEDAGFCTTIVPSNVILGSFTLTSS